MDRTADEALDINCTVCGATFCFNCKEEAHRPVRVSVHGVCACVSDACERVCDVSVVSETHVCSQACECVYTRAYT